MHKYAKALDFIQSDLVQVKIKQDQAELVNRSHANMTLVSFFKYMVDRTLTAINYLNSSIIEALPSKRSLIQTRALPTIPTFSDSQVALLPTPQPAKTNPKEKESSSQPLKKKVATASW